VRIVIGADHGGYHLKRFLIGKLQSSGHRVVDVGTFSPESCDYPKIAAEAADAVCRRQAARAVLLCKSGAGMAIVANKFPGVRAAVCSSVASAKHAREHNDANVLVLGASGLSTQKAGVILRVWLATGFGGGRHARRVNQIKQIDRKLRRGKKVHRS